MNKGFQKSPILLVALVCLLPVAVDGQTTTAPAAVTPKPVRVLKPDDNKFAIDSLQVVIDNLNLQLNATDSLYKAERFTSAGLRDELIKLDDYRKKLENYNENFKGENLKLNQSNRILIIFNSMVAVLLVVTLVFFLKRFGRRKTAEIKKTGPPPSAPPTTEKFASFEDKLQQLERLGKLREKGLLSEDEFAFEKQRILGR